MAGSEANANPACFAQAPLDEAVERLVAIVRRTRPQVMVVYGDDQSGLPPPRPPPGPRGRRGWRSGPPATPTASRRPGEPWQPDKLYYTVFSVARFREIHEKFEELGLESPFDAEWRKRWEECPRTPSSPPRSTSPSSPTCGAEALLAHATQVDPKSPFWFGLPPEVMRTIHPYDDYRLALVAGPDGGIAVPEEPEPEGPADRSRPTCSPACDRRSPAAERPGERVAVGGVVRPDPGHWPPPCRTGPGSSARIQERDHRGSGRRRPLLLGLEDGRLTAAAAGHASRTPMSS